MIRGIGVALFGGLIALAACATPFSEGEGLGSVSSEVKTDCSLVLCAPLACPEGQHRVFRSPNDCCGTCAKDGPAKKCNVDTDCPVYYCVSCPCPYSVCQGRECVAITPDPSTCEPPP